MQKVSGGCLCGSIKYSSTSEPLATTICHCDNCQRQSGTAFSIMVLVPEDSLVIENTDTLSVYLDKAESGNEVQRKFCNQCGSPILSTVEIAPGLSIIKAGTLNDKSWLEPDSAHWCKSAQPWLELSSEISSHDEN